MWKKKCKKVAGFALTGFLAVGMMGCQGGQEEEEILTICVDGGSQRMGEVVN